MRSLVEVTGAMVLTGWVFACGEYAPPIPPPEQGSAKGDGRGADSKDEPTSAAEPKTETTTVPNATDLEADCITSCEEDLDCLEACALVASEANPPSASRGGDASCCVGSQAWVCHSIDANGASCDANQTPPGDHCERVPGNDGDC